MIMHNFTVVFLLLFSFTTSAKPRGFDDNSQEGNSKISITATANSHEGDTTTNTESGLDEVNGNKIQNHATQRAAVNTIVISANLTEIRNLEKDISDSIAPLMAEMEIMMTNFHDVFGALFGVSINKPVSSNKKQCENTVKNGGVSGDKASTSNIDRPENGSDTLSVISKNNGTSNIEDEIDGNESHTFNSSTHDTLSSGTVPEKDFNDMVSALLSGNKTEIQPGNESATAELPKTVPNVTTEGVEIDTLPTSISHESVSNIFRNISTVGSMTNTTINSNNNSTILENVAVDEKIENDTENNNSELDKIFNDFNQETNKDLNKDLNKETLDTFLNDFDNETNKDTTNHEFDVVKNSTYNNMNESTINPIKFIRNELLDLDKEISKQRRTLISAMLRNNTRSYLPKLVDFLYQINNDVRSLVNFTDKVEISRGNFTVEVGNRTTEKLESGNNGTNKVVALDCRDLNSRLPRDCSEAKKSINISRPNHNKYYIVKIQVPSAATSAAPSASLPFLLSSLLSPDGDAADGDGEKSCGDGVLVRCEHRTSDGGWMVMLHRQKQALQVDFARPWADYVRGFGDIRSGEYWIGLDTLHRLTRDRPYELKVEMSVGEEAASSVYTTFQVGAPSDQYRLRVEGYDQEKSTGGDSMEYHNGFRFSTIDRDNDGAEGGSCSQWSGGGGWWYNYCYFSNPTAKYGGDLNSTAQSDSYLEWRKWQGYYTFLSALTMKIRPRQA